MKRLTIILAFLMMPGVVFSQYTTKSKAPNMRNALTAPANSIFGLFNPEKFQMRHSFSSAFVAGGGNSMMINSYVNTMDYRFNNLFSLTLNLGIMNTPYNSFTQNSTAQNPTFNSLNQTRFFGGGELRYKPSEKMQISLGVYSMPNTYYYSPYSNRIIE